MKLSARHVAPLPVTVLATRSKWAPHIAEDSPFLRHPEVSGAVMQPLPFLIATVQLMIQKFFLRESSTQKKLCRGLHSRFCVLCKRLPLQDLDDIEPSAACLVLLELEESGQLPTSEQLVPPGTAASQGASSTDGNPAHGNGGGGQRACMSQQSRAYIAAVGAPLLPNESV